MSFIPLFTGCSKCMSVSFIPLFTGCSKYLSVSSIPLAAHSGQNPRPFSSPHRTPNSSHPPSSLLKSLFLSESSEPRATQLHGTKIQGRKCLQLPQTNAPKHTECLTTQTQEKNLHSSQSEPVTMPGTGTFLFSSGANERTRAHACLTTQTQETNPHGSQSEPVTVRLSLRFPPPQHWQRMPHSNTKTISELSGRNTSSWLSLCVRGRRKERPTPGYRGGCRGVGFRVTLEMKMARDFARSLGMGNAL